MEHAKRGWLIDTIRVTILLSWPDVSEGFFVAIGKVFFVCWMSSVTTVPSKLWNCFHFLCVIKICQYRMHFTCPWSSWHIFIPDRQRLQQVHVPAHSLGLLSMSWVAWKHMLSLGCLQDMLCYSGGGTLSIKTANFPPHQQKLLVSDCWSIGSKASAVQSYIFGFLAFTVWKLQRKFLKTAIVLCTHLDFS